MDSITAIFEELKALGSRLNAINDDPENAAVTNLSMAEHHMIEAEGCLTEYLDEITEEK